MAGGCEYVYYQFKNIFDFVKDKTNLVPHNVWTGTDYLSNTTGFSNECIESSTDWSYNGTRSLKLTRVQESYAYYTTQFSVDLPKNDYIFTFRLYSPNTTGQILLLSNEGNKTLNYNSNANVQLITLSVTNQSIVGVRFVNWSPNTSCYIDEITIRANQ